MQTKEARQIRILVADDHPILREGIRAILDDEHEFILAGEAADGRQALEQFRLLHPDVTLMDLQMPVLGGLESIRLIRAEYPDARLIALTTFSGDVQVSRALHAGAVGYLLKSALRTDLLAMIRAVYGGARMSLSPQVALELAEHVLDEALTDREIEVLRHVAAGESNKSIASGMSLTETTVKSHMKNVMGKLSANDRTHAVVIAMKRGILDG